MKSTSLDIRSVALTLLVVALIWGGWAFWPSLPFWPWWPDDFLGEDDFVGQPVKPESPVGVGGMQGTYIGVLTFSNVDRTSVANLLPSGFELAPRSTTYKSNLHPVVLMFGDATDGAWVLAGGATQPTGIHYSEMILAIPFVQKVGGSGGWHTYIVRMYLDNQDAVAGGIPYGYQKILAQLMWTGDSVEVNDVLGNDLLDGKFIWKNKWYDGNTALSVFPNFQDMVNIMTTEVVGMTLLGPVCSSFEWNFGNARVARASTTYTMKNSFATGMSSWPAKSPFTNVSSGAIVMRGMRWRLGPPSPGCRF